MVNTTARIKKAGKRFEIIVDLDEALKLKKGEISSISVEGDMIFSDSKKGERAPSSDMKEAFGTEDVQEIAKEIITKGEVQTNQEHRSEEQEKKLLIFWLLMLLILKLEILILLKELNLH